MITLRVLRQWELIRPLQNVNLGGIEGRNRDASTMGLMMYYGLAGLSIVGAVSMRRRRIPLLPLGVQFLSVTITSAYTYGSVRFRAPAEPALCVLGAVGLVPGVCLARRGLARSAGDADDSVEADATPFVLRIDDVGSHRISVRADRTAASRSVPYHRWNDGRRVHDGVPGADAER